MKFSDHKGGSTLIHMEIAEHVIETLKEQIDSRLAPIESENLRTHIFYLAMSMVLHMKANEEPGLSNEQRRSYLKKVMGMVEECGTVWYISDEADVET